jgi:CHASE3 domain sensor protein
MRDLRLIKRANAEAAVQEVLRANQGQPVPEVARKVVDALVEDQSPSD